MALLRSVISYSLLFTWFTIVLSKLQSSNPTTNLNLTSSSRSNYEPVALDWRSIALGKYSNLDDSTLKRRECWIMKMGPEDDDTQDVVKCADEKAPTLTQLIAHGRNGTEFGRADNAHTPIFYTAWKDSSFSGAALEGNDPSEMILFYIDRSVTGYVSQNAGCRGGLVLNMKIYTYNNMIRDSWFRAQMAELTDNEEEYEDYVSPDYGFNPLTTLLWCYCQALALAAIPDSGEAWVAIPWDTDNYQWSQSSNWALNEFPALTQNPAIKIIKRYDPLWYFYNPDRVDPSEKEKITQSLPRVLWDREKGDPVFPQDWVCPSI